MGDSLRGISKTDFPQFALLRACLGAASAWITIFVVELGQERENAFAILAGGRFICLGLIIAITLSGIRHKLWHGYLYACIVCWLALAALSAGQIPPIVVMDTLMAAGFALLAATQFSMLADTMTQVADGTNGHIKLALAYMLAPVLAMIVNITLGYMGDIDIALAFAGLGALLSLFALKCRSHVPLSTLKQPFQALWPTHPRVFVLLYMGGIINFVESPLTMVMTPGYIYDVYDGALGHIGTALGILALMALVGVLIRSRLYNPKHRPIGLDTIMFICAAGFAASPIAWAIVYDSAYASLCVLGLRAALGPLWTFAFYAVLQQCATNAYHRHCHAYVMITLAFQFAGFLLVYILGDYIFANPQTYLVIAGSVGAIAIITGAIVWYYALVPVKAR